MKAFVIATVLCFAAYAQGQLSEAQKAQAEKYAKECSAQFGLGFEDVVGLQGKTLSNPGDKLKCFGNCMAEKAGILKNGVLQEGAALEKLMLAHNKEDSMKILNACKNVKGSDNCDMAFKLYECYMNNKAEL